MITNNEINITHFHNTLQNVKNNNSVIEELYFGSFQSEKNERINMIGVISKIKHQLSHLQGLLTQCYHI